MPNWILKLVLETDDESDDGRRIGWRVWATLVLIFALGIIGTFTVRNIPRMLDSLFPPVSQQQDIGPNE